MATTQERLSRPPLREDDFIQRLGLAIVHGDEAAVREAVVEDRADANAAFCFSHTL